MIILIHLKVIGNNVYSYDTLVAEIVGRKLYKVKWRVKFSLNVAESCLPRIVSQLCVLRAEGKFDHVCRNLGSFSGVALGSNPRVSYVPGSDIELWVTDGMLWRACLSM